MTYAEKLKDPRWQRKRLEIMQRDGWTCYRCPQQKTFLSVHHVNYDKGREPWDYPANNFVTLCDPCHKAVEKEIRQARIAIVDAFRNKKRGKKASKSITPDPMSQPASAEFVKACLADLKRRLAAK